MSALPLPPSLWARALEELDFACAVARTDGTLVRLNARARAAWPAEACPAHLQEIRPGWPWEQAWREGLAEARARGSWALEGPVQTAEGERPVRQSLRFFREEEREWLLLTLQDLAALLPPELSMEEKVRQAREEAHDARRARSEFLSRMSHELRTPLNAILGFTQLLELESPTPAQKESIEHIVKAGQHLLSLINEVLDLSRVEAGGLPLHMDAVPLLPLLRDVIEVIRPAARTAGLEVRLELTAPAGDRVRADAQRLRQVLLTLLENGLKFNREGGTLTLRSEAVETGRVQISVIDTGLGISPEKLARLFIPLEKYRRTAHHGSDIGLGLALARGIMDAMGGEIGVRSVVDEGSTFWLELGLAGDEDALRLQEEGGTLDAAVRPRTILYVEDEVLNQQLVCRVLQDHPEYRIVTTGRGREALAMAQKHRPDLILLDLNLPDLSGPQVLQQLKADPVASRAAVVLVTADLMGYRLEALLAAGAAAYLPKPFKIADLLRVIHDALPALAG